MNPCLAKDRSRCAAQVRITPSTSLAAGADPRGGARAGRGWLSLRVSSKAAIGRPVAALLDTLKLSHPRPARAPPRGSAPAASEVDGVIRTCAAHLLRSFARHGFIPTYAAFN